MKKTENTPIATRQVFFISTSLLVIIGHFFLIRLYLEWSGRDAWIGMIIGFLLGFIIFLAMAKLNEKLYGNTIVEHFISWCGPWFGRVLTIPIIFYYFILALITLYGLSQFINSVFLSDHPLWLISIVFSLAVFYMVHQGIEVIARVAEWIIIINILSGLSISFLLRDKKDYSQLLPILEDGFIPIIPVIVFTIAVFGEMLVLLMVNVRKESKKSISYMKVYIILFIANLIIFPSTASGPVAIFGEEQAKQLTYPVESMVRLISVGFIERFDIYGLSIMSVSAFLRLALLHYGTSLAIAQWFNLKDYRYVNWLLGGLLFYASIRTFDHIVDFYNFLSDYYFYGVISVIFILLLTLAITIFPKLTNSQDFKG
ncbi:hypothetical protein BKP45_10410 [Anaerobacillus alkalidiazotrophicus]|uniref:Uncharacterized protein n=1 Tax=Anaerobacillus alkalidiazotrophicus TaxID=472963 RepID=A0A1S2M5P5_9BACI|nr:endospore germination permease [Anaerobacillus alkalidiazotrophicus]OIJ20078.1 hypothetical protein BKP45_10410 [Anaerobacillus alkalidiazotrophicus]